MEPAIIDGVISTCGTVAALVRDSRRVAPPPPVVYSNSKVPLLPTHDITALFYFILFSLALAEKRFLLCIVQGHEILIKRPAKYGKNFNLLCFYRGVLFPTDFWVKSDLGETRGLCLARCSAPVTDVSHLFLGMKLRDARALPGGIFFLFFFASNFGEGRLSQVNEADNYA